MRILFVAPLGSFHPARWISQITDQGWDIHVFDPSEISQVHEDLSDVTVHSLLKLRSRPGQNIRNRCTYPFFYGQRTIKQRLPRLLPNLFPSSIARLRGLIIRLRPDVIHSLRTQDEGYITHEALNGLSEKSRPPWIHSTYGSDFYYFGRFDEHRTRLQRLARGVDFLISDCNRDVDLVKDFGFHGATLGVFPTPGGYDIEQARSLVSYCKPSDRRVVLVKGKEHWAGRGLTAMRAVEASAEILQEYKIAVHSPSRSVILEAGSIAQRTGLNIEIIPYGSRQEMLKLKGQARVEIALSISDGTPNGMLEAMMMGAFPIQSNTAAISEWITQGLNGQGVPYDDLDAIVSALHFALENNDTVDAAAEYNYQLIKQRLDIEIVKPQVIDLYQQVATQSLKGSMHFPSSV